MPSARRRLVTVTAAVAAAFAGAIFWAAPAAAESISDLDVAATVAPDTSLRVVESITYDFEGEYRHGIFRDLPLYDETLTGQRRDYDVTVTSVTMDGGVTPWVLTEEGPFLNVRIGDPATTITGPHTYVIEYTVRDALRVITGEDVADPLMPDQVAPGDVELYWDFVGTGWDVPIARARASVTGPGDVLSAVCYSGAAGGDRRCPAAAVASVALLGPVSLAPGEALTGAVVFPRASFLSTPRERVTQGLPSSPVVGILGALLPAALLAGVPITLALSRRRRDAGAPVPGAPPQYGPPDSLTPAELSAAWEGRKGVTDPRVLVATLLDLAARRWIDVSTDAAGDLSVTWIGTGTTPLRSWEESLMGTILKGGSFATLTGYDKVLTTHWGSTVRTLVEEQEAAGRRNPHGDEPDRRWRWLGLVAFALVAVGVVMLFIGQAFAAAACLTAGIGAIVGFVAARIITPRSQTTASAQFLAKVDGLRTVLGTDPAASRREFAHRSGLSADAIFATMLPFAVVFGLESSWIGAFPDLTEDQLISHGFYAGGIGSMDSFVSSGTSSMSSAMTAPSSGSGGGGSSGGGGGGGGGGSW
jgi:uncharacterized membrane protein YgcG